MGSPLLDIVDNNTVNTNVFNNWESYKVFGNKASGKICAMLKEGVWISPTTLKSPSGHENKDNELVQMDFVGEVSYTFDPASKRLSHFDFKITNLKLKGLKTGGQTLSELTDNEEAMQGLRALLTEEVKTGIEVTYCWI